MRVAFVSHEPNTETPGLVEVPHAGRERAIAWACGTVERLATA